jgi:isocitrate dehydrogenase (NAD+)
MGLNEQADRIEKATLAVSLRLNNQTGEQANGQTIAEGKHITRDLGGKAGTQEYTDAILARL